jgi:hypothetical protein
VDFSPPVEDGAELVGAEQVHRVLRRWLRECAGPQVPLEISPPPSDAEAYLPVDGPAVPDKNS